MNHKLAISVAFLFACAVGTLPVFAGPPRTPAFSAFAALAAGEGETCFPPMEITGFRYRGARTCQSAACHGSLDPKVGKIRRNEYTIWRSKDPHAKAYTNMSLDNKLAAQILTRLGYAKNNKIVDQAGFQSCEKCHNLTVPVEKPEGAEILHEGVSCEACHGPSEKWYAEHFKVGFDLKDAVAKKGMIDTDNVFVRARLCVQCHVGAADREVNHDLLAAGHPQLRFEMAGYQQILPKHWNDAVERRSPGKEQFELRLWTAGQIASADASLAQLEARAKRAAAKSPGAVWPEFAEMDCFACHHDLKSPSWRQQRGYGSRKPGNLPWGSWYFGLVERFASKDETPAAKQFQASLASLKKTLESGISPDPEVVAKEARAAREALYQWAQPDGKLVATAARPARLREMFGLFADKGSGSVEGAATVETWETATQLYLAVSAVNQAYRDESRKPETADDKAIAARIGQLRKDLAFIAGYDSPHEFGGLTEGAGAQSSPRERVRRDLLQVFQQLNRRGDK
jgi:hypothetical protein